ncbi:MAG: DUF4810 domain-containing protein [Gammaproteobacteria bacterium]|nr:DUF4810 domain-containing protein [Gammaproteobacteria bacterium]
MIKQFLLLTVVSVTMLGCAQKPQTHYEWEGYQPSIYSYLVPDKHDTQAQVATLEKTIEKAQAKGTRAAPGMHAHLALLYFNLGRDEEAVGHLVTEKQLFPESTEFVNFLIEKQGQF